MRSHVLSHVWLSVTPRTVARQTPLSMRFSRQEYWKGLPFPPPGDLPGPGIKPKSLAGGFFTTKSPGNPYSDPRSPKKSTPASYAHFSPPGLPCCRGCDLVAVPGTLWIFTLAVPSAWNTFPLDICIINSPTLLSSCLHIPFSMRPLHHLV